MKKKVAKKEEVPELVVADSTSKINRVGFEMNKELMNDFLQRPLTARDQKGPTTKRQASGLLMSQRVLTFRDPSRTLIPQKIEDPRELEYKKNERMLDRMFKREKE